MRAEQRTPARASLSAASVPTGHPGRKTDVSPLPPQTHYLGPFSRGTPLALRAGKVVRLRTLRTRRRHPVDRIASAGSFVVINGASSTKAGQRPIGVLFLVDSFDSDCPNRQRLGLRGQNCLADFDISSSFRSSCDLLWLGSSLIAPAGTSGLKAFDFVPPHQSDLPQLTTARCRRAISSHRSPCVPVSPNHGSPQSSQPDCLLGR